jgi:hypothetical protein
MTRRSPHSFSQIFPAHKTSTLRFHRCGSHILQKPPLMSRLGLHHPSPKVGITPSFTSALNICETEKSCVQAGNNTEDQNLEALGWLNYITDSRSNIQGARSQWKREIIGRQQLGRHCDRGK